MSRPVAQIFYDFGNHRLVHEDGRKTRLASYTQFTYLDGWVGCTDYYTGTGGAIMSAEDFCKIAGVSELEK